MKTIFKASSEGEEDVGINGLAATITIEDNYQEISKEDLEFWKEKIKNYYEEIGEGTVEVSTIEEIKKENDEMEKILNPKGGN